MKVSIITPTLNREAALPRLYRVFAAQTHRDCELLVLDDSPQPSLFFSGLADPRVRYVHSPERLTVGAKRNRLAAMATGDVIMHFDDDDYYAPDYVATMLRHLGDADFVKLNGWYLYSQTHNAFAYWDLTAVAAHHYRMESERPLDSFHSGAFAPAEARAWGEKTLMGWGFCYVYRRSAWARSPFADLRHGEDTRFLLGLAEAGCTVRQVADHDGIALVIRHRYDHSIVFPQYLLPLHLLPRIFGGEVAPFLAGV